MRARLRKFSSSVCKREVSAALARSDIPADRFRASDRGAALGVVDIFVTGDATVDGPAQQVRQRKLRIAVPRVGQVLGE